MTLFSILAVIVASSLALLFLASFAKVPKEKRKLYLFPGVFQLFAISVALVRGGILPKFLPAEIVTVFCYFFSLYLTYSTALSLATSRKKISALWGIAAVSFWILAIWG